MEKQLLDMDMDPTMFICVNPYEVNPVMQNTMILSPTLSVDIPIKGDVCVAQQNSETPSGQVYGQHTKIKLEMEEFGDLSSYVLPKLTSTNIVDELNTPIFDKDAFDFNVNVYDKDCQSEELFIKLERDAYNENTCILTDNNQLKNFSFNTEKVNQNENMNSVVGSIFLQNSDFKVSVSELENDSAYSYKISPTYKNTSLYNVDDSSALSVNSTYNQCSYIASSNEVFQQIQSGLETPDDSNSSAISLGSNVKSPRLTLNINPKKLANDLSLNTPNIIEEVVDLESANFNILDLVANEDIKHVGPEDIFSISSLPPMEGTGNTYVIKNDHQLEKRPRKRQNYDDDSDEDYIPPTKRNVQEHKRVVKYSESEESDSDTTIQVKQKRKPRGRPPKRTESVSSDCSKDSDVSKYRELRDKNNEASRKSRLKRKVKEHELEKEADELICRNIKLKAQVEELEKMVTNFRDNLFKIMIKK